MNRWSSKFYVPDLIEPKEKSMRYESEEGIDDLDGDNAPLCVHCNGSGEGMYDGTICGYCGGSGAERSDDRDPPEVDDYREEE